MPGGVWCLCLQKERRWASKKAELDMMRVSLPAFLRLLCQWLPRMLPPMPLPPLLNRCALSQQHVQGDGKANAQQVVHRI